MAKKDDTYRCLSLNVAVILRKNPELSAQQVLNQLKKRGKKTELKDVRALWKSWHTKPHNGRRIIEYRTGKKGSK
ncbi:MAG TPA: hypothetical protein P5096_02395 [Patescibacteria group bacterium]|nr:hypothetical protein [Patescibacteria group bacterium]